MLSHMNLDTTGATTRHEAMVTITEGVTIADGAVRLIIATIPDPDGVDYIAALKVAARHVVGSVGAWSHEDGAWSFAFEA